MKKKVLLILVLLVSMFFSCCNVKASGVDDPRTYVEVNQTATTTINGKSINWHYGVYTDGKIY